MKRFVHSIQKFKCFLPALYCCAIGLPFARAHETDQYSVPTGRQFADLRFWLSDYMYDKLEAAVASTNEKIRRSLRDGQPTSATAKLQTPETLSWALLLEFPPVIHHIETVELQLQNRKLRAQYPGLLTTYLPAQWIYHHPLLVLDLSKLARLTRSSTMMANGVYFGTDKIAHFAHMGYLYSEAYRASLGRGESPEVATKNAIYLGAGGHPLSEKSMMGFLSTGVVSNADKAVNYVGMKMFINLTEPVMLKGATHPPLLVRDGELFRLNAHIRRGSNFFNAFVSDHWNEALNPNTYAPGQARWVMEEVHKRCPDILAWYLDESGQPCTKAAFRKKAEELSTYYGEEYGYEGNLDDMVSIMTACFDGENPSASTVLTYSEPSGKTDALGRTSFWRAARAGRLGEVESLLHSPQVSQADIDGETPLHAAVRGGSVAVVRSLLRSGATHAANKHGVTPLHLAAQSDGLDAVKVLLENGADPDAPDEFGCTPLHDAARRGSHSVVTLLLKSGAKVQLGDSFGTTPLHRAARAGSMQVVRLLLAAGASSQSANSFGKTPMDEAKAGRNAEIVALLAQARKPGLALDHAAGSAPEISLPAAHP